MVERCIAELLVGGTTLTATVMVQAGVGSCLTIGAPQEREGAFCGGRFWDCVAVALTGRARADDVAEQASIVGGDTREA